MKRKKIEIEYAQKVRAIMEQQQQQEIMTTEEERTELCDKLCDYIIEHMDDLDYNKDFRGSQIVCNVHHYIRDKLLDDIFIIYPSNNDKFTSSDFDDFYNTNEWLFNQYVWEHEGLMEIKNIDDINMFWEQYSYNGQGVSILEKFNFMCQYIACILWRQIVEWNKEEDLGEMLMELNEEE